MGVLSYLSTVYNIVTGFLHTSNDHKERLNAFYGCQASQYDEFRKNFLWGRTPLITMCEAALTGKEDSLVWIDMGGGTAYNVEIMSKVIPLERFKKIYIVDLCDKLCEEAQKKKDAYGWTNVEIVCDDACTVAIPEKADLITFSYSLSMIPPFHKAVDHANALLKNDGIIGIADFYVSERFDKPDRQMSVVSRQFWRGFFDLDNVQLGPERRAYVEHVFDTVHDFNAYGSIPLLRFLYAPYYVMIGKKRGVNRSCSLQSIKDSVVIEKSKAPALFPPTFLYHQSWEDPREDEKVLDLKSTDVCLTLTSGGCNTLNLLLNGVAKVVSVDVNPAQTALLELKAIAIKQLDYNDFWKLFGEGKHPNFGELYRERLAPLLSPASRKFWDRKKKYFSSGLYYHGSMGKVALLVQNGCKLIGIDSYLNRLVHATSLRDQERIWKKVNSALTSKTQMINYMVQKLFGIVFLNKFMIWFGGGVPKKQAELIKQDNCTITKYFFRCLDGVMKHSHIAKDNYFYYNILTGKYSKDCCPAYLKEENFLKLKQGLIDNLIISTDYFMNELHNRKYDKVILMDHADWQDEDSTLLLAKALYGQMNEGGKIILRSAGLEPPYATQLQECGFDVECISRIDQQPFMDRVNMYASFYVCTK